MKRIPLRFFIGLTTFLVSIFATGAWIFYCYRLNVPRAESITTPFICNNTPVSLGKKPTDSEKIEWNKEILGRFKEETIETLSSEESYRLILLPTFDAPIVVRAWRSGENRFLVTKKLSGKGGFGVNKLGKLTYENTRPLTEDEWRKLVALIERSSFWCLPSRENEDPINDGAVWVLEAKIEGKYHNVDRILPNKELLESFINMLKLSGFEKDYEGYWK